MANNAPIPYHLDLTPIEMNTQRLWIPRLLVAMAIVCSAAVHAKPPFKSDDSPPADAHASQPVDIKRLPLIEVPALQPGKTFAVIISGDGGWAGIDKTLAKALATAGIPSVGLDSLRYLWWNKHTPDELGSTLREILSHYFTAWNRKNVILIGYSRGADMLPFMASRLSPELLQRTSLIALLGAEHDVDFEISIFGWMQGSSKVGEYKVKPEVEKLAGNNLLCVYGAEESSPLCPDLDPTRFTVVQVPGDHHFGGNYQLIAELIVRYAH